MKHMSAFSRPEVLCIGETMGVVTPARHESFRAAQDCLLGVGGAESNVASHMADFGLSVAWASRVGNDAFGDRILDELAARGVDLRWAIRDSTASTGIYFKEPDTGGGAHTYYYRSGSAASRMTVWDLSTWPLADVNRVHLTGITPALSESCANLAEQVLHDADKVGYRVSFDVNYRSALWPAEKAGPHILSLANLAHTVLVGLDEAETLWGCVKAEDVAALLPGPSHLVVKDSAVEAVEFTRTTGGSQEIHRVPAQRVDVVEPVGAGDAFAGGYLTGLIRGDCPDDRLRLGHSLAAWTLGSRLDFRPGHGPGIRNSTPSESTHERTGQ
jgi:2-dehydro-3-deoxygluconokinase